MLSSAILLLVSSFTLAITRTFLNGFTVSGVTDGSVQLLVNRVEGAQAAIKQTTQDNSSSLIFINSGF
jgi:hypothetical protein